MCSANNELSEYEKIRLNNIKEREALFKQLGIQELKNDARASTVKKPKSVLKKVPSYRVMSSNKKISAISKSQNCPF